MDVSRQGDTRLDDDDTALGVSDALVLTNWVLELAPATGATGDC